MKEIPLNATVICGDGETGESTHIIINPVNQEVTHIVVQINHEGKTTDHLVPLAAVIGSSSDQIEIHLTKEELAELPRFTVRHYLKAGLSDEPGERTLMQPYVTTPAEANLNLLEEELVPPGEMALFRGASVEALDGPLGRLSELLIDSTRGHISHLVVKTGTLWSSKEITVPLSAVEEATTEAIYLKLDKAAIEQLPAVPLKRHYLGDEEIQVELVTMIFKTKAEAEEMLDFLQELQRRGTLKLRNAAVLVKDQAGKLTFRETEDVDAWHGTLFGAVTGGLIGLLGGPVGAVVGAIAGASTGGMAADWLDSGFDNDFLQRLNTEISAGEAMLVLLVEHEWLQGLSESVAEREGVVLQHSLPDDVVSQFVAQSRIA